MGAPRFVSRDSGRLTVACDLLGGDGGSPITAYRFTYYDSSIAGGFTSSVHVSQAVDPANFALRQATISGLTDGSTYTMTCQAQNAVCYSQASAATNIQAGTVSCPVTNVVTTNLADRSRVLLSGNLPACTGGCAITGYIVALRLSLVDNIG